MHLERLRNLLVCIIIRFIQQKHSFNSTHNKEHTREISKGY